MKNEYDNILNSERTVEVNFISEMYFKYIFNECKILDVGGIPSKESDNLMIYQTLDSLKEKKYVYDISDFRGGKYKGDFVTLNIPEKYDIITFLSSLEHFPQCTEGDMKFRKNEDKLGFQKAIQLLNENGKIILTVPFGKPVWQPYHQNYDIKLINDISSGTHIIEQYIYVLKNNKWILIEDLSTTENILYTDKAYCVGCFVFEKNK